MASRITSASLSASPDPTASHRVAGCSTPVSATVSSPDRCLRITKIRTMEASVPHEPDGHHRLRKRLTFLRPLSWGASRRGTNGYPDSCNYFLHHKHVEQC